MREGSPFYIYPREALDITISVLAISLAVLIAINIHTNTNLFSNPILFTTFYIVFVFTIGAGFVLHELSHKAVAIYFGAKARFVMWWKGLLLMFLTSIFGFVLAAPGAVYIFTKKISKMESGMIASAGPMMNIVLSLMFALFYLFARSDFFPINIWLFGAYINALLAAFNMLPFGPLDGKKIISWNIFVWFFMLIISVWLMLNYGGAMSL